MNTTVGTAVEIAQNIFGVYELDAGGVVLYSRAALPKEAHDNSKFTSQVGRNFFDDIIKFDNAGDLRRRIEIFMLNQQSVESFHFTCRAAEQAVQTRIMLVRISERSEYGRAKSIIMDIRKD